MLNRVSRTHLLWQNKNTLSPCMYNFFFNPQLRVLPTSGAVVYYTIADARCCSFMQLWKARHVLNQEFKTHWDDATEICRWYSRLLFNKQTTNATLPSLINSNTLALKLLANLCWMNYKKSNARFFSRASSIYCNPWSMALPRSCPSPCRTPATLVTFLNRQVSRTNIAAYIFAL